jgi:hypothetical protein
MPKWRYPLLEFCSENCDNIFINITIDKYLITIYCLESARAGDAKTFKTIGVSPESSPERYVIFAAVGEKLRPRISNNWPGEDS